MFVFVFPRMASLLTRLPAPKHAPLVAYEEDSSSDSEEEDTKQVIGPSYPPYGKRRGWTPLSDKDFGDGGAFPEVHVLQYPLGMGRKEKGNSTAVALKVDSDGKIKFDQIVKRGHKLGKHIQSTLDDMKPKEILDGLEKPDEEEIRKTTEKTAAALNLIVDRNTAAARATHVKKHNKEVEFIRYTPNQQSLEHNSGAKQRIIRLQEMPVDPFEPPKFKHKKLPNGPPSPPVPVMHSPPRKITAADQASWKIPPCISHWKNIKGYTIPLHHRLAADGRDLTQVKINPKFESLAQGLFIAERTARHEIQERSVLRKQVERQKKERKEDLLFKMAQQAQQGLARDMEDRDEEDYGEEQEEDVEAREERSALRKDRQREIRRDMRTEQRKADKRQEKGRARDSERDVSERIALGQKVGGKSKDSMYDSRLFNHSSDMSQGSTFDIYSKPLFNSSASQGIYRPKSNLDNDQYSGQATESLLEKSTSKFKADRGFEGSESSNAGGAGGRDKPVQFEADPFGLGQVFTDAKDTRTGSRALGKIGSKGGMSANAGGSRLDRDDASMKASGISGRTRKMEFSEDRGSSYRSSSDKRQRR